MDQNNAGGNQILAWPRQVNAAWRAA